MKKKFERNFAIKIINQYADNYKLLEKENLNLKNEIMDIKSNLNINKEIIESFFKKDESEKSYLLYLNQLKTEMKALEEQKEKLTKEKNSLHDELIKNENIINKLLTKKEDKTKEYKNKIFVLENIIIKKNALIENLEKKYLSILELKDDNEEKEIREIYITDPNENLLILYKDLCLYKTSYENILKKIKIYKFEIEDLKNKLKEKNSNNKTAYTTKLIDEIIQNQTKKNWETDEWLAILKYLNFTNDDIQANTHNNKFMSKLLDAIELLNRILIKRNNKINELEKVISKLKEDYKDLSNENIKLLKNNYMLKGLNGNLQNKKDKSIRASGQFINTNISLINNISLDNNNKDNFHQIFLKNLPFSDKSVNNKIINQSMVVENNFSNSKFQNNTSNSNYSLDNAQKHINLTQSSSENSEVLNNDVLNQLNHNVLKKLKKDNDDDKNKDKNIIKNLNFSADNF
jgi:hypothetical protein